MFFQKFWKFESTPLFKSCIKIQRYYRMLLAQESPSEKVASKFTHQELVLHLPRHGDTCGRRMAQGRCHSSAAWNCGYLGRPASASLHRCTNFDDRLAAPGTNISTARGTYFGIHKNVATNVAAADGSIRKKGPIRGRCN